MRTEDRWKDVIRNKIICRKFPPRIIEDFMKYNIPDIQGIKGCYIWSDVKECGKTITACQILLGLEKTAHFECSPIKSVFLPVDILKTELKASFDNPNQSEIDILKKYQDVDVLVLDDLGTCKLSEWMFEILYSLINYRYEYLKTTIITSNYSIEQLAELWNDDRITSRIVRSGEVFEKEHYLKRKG